MTYCLYDMHCHLDRILDAERVAAEAEERGLAIFCAPVTPAGTLAARRALGRYVNVCVGVGLHPWWIDSGECGEQEVLQAARLIADARFVGEVGLDFGRAHVGSREAQVAAFERLIRDCAERSVPGRVLSVHAVRSSGEILDVLERCGLTGTGSDASCIFHWFSGTSDELARLRCAGCYVSVNPMMLSTKRGREYARIMPVDRILLETDAPPGLDTPYTAGEIAAALETVLDTLAEIRHADRAELARRIADTSARLLGI